MNVTQAIAITARSSSLSAEIRQVLQDANPIIAQLASELKVNMVFEQDGLRSSLSSSSPLVTKYEFDSEFVYMRHIDDDFTALWICTGNTIIPPTLLTRL